MLTDREYKHILVNKAFYEAKWVQHLENLKKVKPECYDFKTCVPVHLHHCYVC